MKCFHCGTPSYEIRYSRPCEFCRSRHADDEMTPPIRPETEEERKDRFARYSRMQPKPTNWKNIEAVVDRIEFLLGKRKKI